MRYTSKKIITAVSGLTNPTSAAIDASSFKSFSVQSVATGTIAGSFQVQASNVDTPGASDWFNVGSAQTISSAGTQNTVVADSPYLWVRAAFTSSGGTGNISAWLKSVGW